MFAAGRDSAALLQYEACCFYGSSKSEKTTALFNKSLVYKKLGYYEQSVFTLKRLLKFNPEVNLKTEIYYELALNQYLGDSFGESLISVDSLRIFENNNLSEEASLVEIFALNELGGYVKSSKLAEEFVNRFIPEKQKDSVMLAVKAHWNEKNFPRLKNQKTAMILSRIVPGSGQIYAGYPFEGVFNLLLQSACLTYGIFEFWHGYYLTGYVGGISLFTKFYIGGPGRARFLVQKTNYRRTKSFNDRAVDLLIRK